MRVTQERDALNERTIVRVAVIGVVATAVGVWLAWQLQNLTERGLGAPVDFVAARQGSPPADMHAIEMNLFGQTAEAKRTRHSPARLREYGWSDRQRGTLHIPLDRAVLLYLGGQRASAPKAPAPASSSSPGTVQP